MLSLVKSNRHLFLIYNICYNRIDKRKPPELVESFGGKRKNESTILHMSV